MSAAGTRSCVPGAGHRYFSRAIPEFSRRAAGKARFRDVGVAAKVRVVTSCHRCPAYVDSICDRASGASCPAVCAGPVDPPPDEDRVAALFEQYHRFVVAWACRITGSYELARDLAQDVFIKAWGGLDRFRGDAQFTTWLYAITRNRCHDYLRARAARPREVGDGALAAAPPLVENDAVEWVEAQHAATLVRWLIRDARLDAIEASAFRLHYGADVPLQVVTRQLGLNNASGARARLLSAKRKLRRSAERWRRHTLRTPARRRTA